MGQQDNTAPEPRFEVVQDRRPAAAAVKFYRIRNLERYQHYKERNPPWVKLHSELLDDYEFQQLPDASRYHYLHLTLLASKTGNKIHNDPVWVARRIGASDPINLSLLFEAGLLEPWTPRAQAPAPGEQLALPEPEVGAANPSVPTGSTDASNMLATCLQVASTETETEVETEAHTETDTGAASAARLCGCCSQSVCSEFSYGEALALAQAWKAEGRLVGGRRIENPGGLARTLHREGTADADIRKLLRPPPRREFTDEACPSCLGTLWQTVPGEGAKKCPDCRDEAGRRTGKRAKDYGGRGP